MAKIVISGKEMEEAEIVWFNPQKRFGFVRVYQTGQQIFFHANDGRMLLINNDKIVFGDATSSRRLHDPRIGDQIFFVRAKGKKGPKASPWTPVDEFILVDSALTDLISVCDCGHLMVEHAGGVECMISDCHCGDEAYERDDYEPREVNLSDSPGGLKIYE